jgi:hypothetical protein
VSYLYLSYEEVFVGRPAEKKITIKWGGTSCGTKDIVTEAFGA